MIEIALMGFDALSNLISGFLDGEILLTGNTYVFVGTVFLFHWVVFYLAYLYKTLSNRRG